MLINSLIRFVLFFFLLVLIPSSFFAQEICDNGIDDDGNGLIDLQDSTCNCKWTLPQNTPSIILNHSFEDTLCCPTNHSQITCARGWQRGTIGSSDYFNTCGYLPPRSLFFKPQPTPIADGNGFAGFLHGPNVNTEYIGICLSDTLFAGVSYKLLFQVAHARGVDTGSFGLFGADDCSLLPITSLGCPTMPSTSPWVSSDWECLDSVDLILDTNNVWNDVLMTFTPSTDITTIIIGPSCKFIQKISYYYLDNLILNEFSYFEPSLQIKSQGIHCQDNLVLHANYTSIPNSIQWYKDSIALIGHTSSSYRVAKNEHGTFTVRMLSESGCEIASYQVFNDKYEVKMPNVFSPNMDGINDFFKPIKFNCVTDFSFFIYNRWGQIVYKTNSFPISWDGTFKGEKCSSGTYFWVLKSEKEKQKLKGNISLFR